jgi:hypothetical protein
MMWLITYDLDLNYNEITTRYGKQRVRRQRVWTEKNRE